jgi:ABC-type Zn uptake system ZnuABC Zn-binding protein ZnuA
MIKPVAITMRVIAVLATFLLSMTTAALDGVAELLTIVSQDILAPFAKQITAANAKLESVGK